ncbi:MAG: class I SAM-dependent methyltransferase [Verrucomicrobiae bacterium]|nr:class I SAM-dependent methyltransferase [Verrucomicrobiae bacterium]
MSSLLDPNPFLIPAQWPDYELLDSGNGMKRERWGKHILIRPEAEAFWPRHDLNAWKEWDGWFRSSHHSSTSGEWHWKKKSLPPWNIDYNNLHFLLHPTATKQIGLFPEQASNWEWCAEQIAKTKISSPRVLNLFGYTGAASVAAAAAGATVCHVDSSKAAVQWCSENARLSEIPHGAIRFIVDDCSKFIAREQRRGNRYDAIILDPPTFGRGRSGELWRLEDHLEELLSNCLQLLTPSPLFLLLNTYSPRLSTSVLKEIFTRLLKQKEIFPPVIAPLAVQGTRDEKVLPCGITSRILWKA